MLFETVIACTFAGLFLLSALADLIEDKIREARDRRHAEIMREPWEPGYRGKG